MSCACGGLDLVAQLAEHWTSKPKIAGSILTAVKQFFINHLSSARPQAHGIITLDLIFCHDELNIIGVLFNEQNNSVTQLQNRKIHVRPLIT